MKVMVMFFGLCALLLAGCGSSEPASSEKNTLASFYKELDVWLGGDKSAGPRVCDFLAESQLQDSRSYARAATGGNLCQGALEENFSFLIEDEDFALLSIEAIEEPEKVVRRGATVWVQPVRVSMTVDGASEETLARAAAVVENGQIQSLDGARLSTIAPEQFAQNLGSPTVIRVDPISAAYYSSLR